MQMNVAFDVVIGLVFIYLLYSLYATILMEIISSILNLRAKNLRYAIARMLMDEFQYKTQNNQNEFWGRILTSVIRAFGYPGNMKHPELYERFFAQPSIKYLSSGGLGNSPSYLSAENFSKGLIDAIKTADSELNLLARVEQGLKLIPENSNSQNLFEYSQMLIFDLKEIATSLKIFTVDPVIIPTKQQLVELDELLKKNEVAAATFLSLENNTKSSNDALKTHLAKVQTYRKEVSSWSLLARSQEIKKHISELLDQVLISILQLKLLPESLEISDTRLQLQSLLDDSNNDLAKFKMLLERWYNDTMERASGWFKQTTQVVLIIIGICLTWAFDINTIEIVQKLSKDEVARGQLIDMALDFSHNSAALLKNPTSTYDSVQNQIQLKAALDSLLETKKMVQNDIKQANSILFSAQAHVDTSDKDPPKKVFLGYLLTILALSLGAPFWFDLLNKLVKLRTSKGVQGDEKSANSDISITNKTSLNRVG